MTKRRWFHRNTEASAAEDRVENVASVEAADAAVLEERMAVLQRISKNEQKPELPEEQFFDRLKRDTAYAYYTSKIGIHQEMEYKGNVYLQEFAGYEVK